MQKAIVIYAAVLAAFISACDVSYKEKQAEKKSLPENKQTLEREMEKINDSLTVLNNKLLKANEKLKKAQSFQYINSAAKYEEINIASYNIQCIEKKISNLKMNMTVIKGKIQVLQVKAQ